MKKLLALLVVALFAMTVTACPPAQTTEPATDQAAPAEEQTTTPPAEEQPAPAEEGTTEGGSTEGGSTEGGY